MTKREKTYYEALTSRIPASPEHVRTVLAVCGENISSAREISRAILRDPGLTVHLLRLANSTYYYTPGRPGIASVRHAVVCIGTNQIIKQMRSIPLLAKRSPASSHPSPVLTVIARSRLGTLVAEALSEKAGADPEELILCTILRHLGLAFLATVRPTETLSILKTRPNTAARERLSRTLTGWFPEELGSALARAWNLPEGLQQRMSYTARGKNSFRGNLSTIAAASAIQEMLETGMPRKREAALCEALGKSLGLTGDAVDSAIRQGVSAFADTEPLFHDELKNSRVLSRA